MLGQARRKTPDSCPPQLPRTTGGPGAAVLWSVRLLALTALATAGYLAWVSLQSGASLIGCGGLPQFDCEHVLGSRWSTWLAVPVSLPAAAVYGTIFAATLLIGSGARPRAGRLGWTLLMLLVPLAAGAALWFVVLLLFVVKRLCIYCMIVHACGVGIAVLILLRMPRRRARDAHRAWTTFLGTSSGAGREERSRPGDSTSMDAAAAWWPSVLGLAGVAVLIAGQLLFPPEQYRIELIGDVAGEPPGAGPTNVSQGGEPPRLVSSTVEDPDPPLAEEVPAEVEEEEGDDLEPRAPLPPAEPETTAAVEEPPVLEPSRFRVAEIPDRTAATAPTGADRTDPRSPSIRDGRVVLDPNDHPVLGRPDAKHVVVELFDYTCKHCRALHHHLQRAREQLGNEFAIVVLPMPMNSDCNQFVDYTHPDHRQACDYARLALAVWETDPAAFETYHHWLLEAERPPSVSEATDRAERLIGQEALRSELQRSSVDRRILGYTRFYAQVGSGGVPKLLIGKHAVTLQSVSPERVMELLQRYLDY